MWRVFLIYVLLESVLFWSCSEDDDACIGDDAIALVGGINARNVLYESYNSIFLIPPGDTIPKDNHVIWLEVDPDYVSQYSSGSLPGRLMACSVQPSLSAEIEKIEIFAGRALNDSIETNFNLSEQFHFYTRSDELASLNDMDLMNQQFQSEFYLFLVSSVKPENTLVQYTVSLKLADGRIFNLLTEPVYLK